MRTENREWWVADGKSAIRRFESRGPGLVSDRLMRFRDLQLKPLLRRGVIEMGGRLEEGEESVLLLERGRALVKSSARHDTTEESAHHMKHRVFHRFFSKKIPKRRKAKRAKQKKVTHAAPARWLCGRGFRTKVGYEGSGTNSKRIKESRRACDIETGNETIV